MRSTDRLLVVLTLLILVPVPVAASAPLDSLSLHDAREGLDHLYHARPNEAAASFERIRARHPESAAPDFLLGGIQWHVLTTGPQGFTAGGPAEREFFARMDAAIEIGEAAIEENPDDLSARFFVGGAYGYKARYLALHENWWDAYRNGRKGVSHLEHVVEKDPDFADAYLGLGIYHYYADVLPSVLKFFAVFVGMNGDRERGLEEIRRALRDGVLVEEECRFFLAEIYTTFEKDQWKALAQSRLLRDRYPEHELYTWINARVLDELHLTGLSAAEWQSLDRPDLGPRLQGFLDYRLARSRLFGGDFRGAADDLHLLLKFGRLGSRRISMWGRIRYGLALDFLGRHDEAMKQYEIAKELDASDVARERAERRLSAGHRDPSVISLEELEETARILKETRRHGEDALRATEELVTGPPRGMSDRTAKHFYLVLVDLAEARLRRGDASGCIAAVDRAFALGRRVPRDSEGELLAMRARGLARLGKTKEAIEEMRVARRRVDSDRGPAVEADLAALSAPPPVPPEPPAGVGVPLTFRAIDRGEISLAVEGNFLPPGRLLPMHLEDGTWVATWPVPASGAVRYRFVADGRERRIDPRAPGLDVDGEDAWSVTDSGELRSASRGAVVQGAGAASTK